MSRPDPHIELWLYESDIRRIMGALELSAAHVEMTSRTMAAFGGKDLSPEVKHLRAIKDYLKGKVEGGGA